MSSALNRTTRAYLTSVNTPEYPVGSWIIEPDMSAVAGFASKYWIITGDVVTLMDAGARAAVDAAELGAARDAVVAGMDALEAYDRAFANIVLDEVNDLRAWVASFKVEAAAATSLANLQTRIATLPATPARTLAQLKTALRNKLGV